MSMNCANMVSEGFDREFAGNEWKAHPEFGGVWLKALLSKDESNGILRSLLVRVEKGGELTEHIHENECEMHEVIAGDGVTVVGGKPGVYKTGSIAFINKGVKHSVKAGKSGIILLAKFF